MHFSWIIIVVSCFASATQPGITQYISRRLIGHEPKPKPIGHLVKTDDTPWVGIKEEIPTTLPPVTLHFMAEDAKNPDSFYPSETMKPMKDKMGQSSKQIHIQKATSQNSISGMSENSADLLVINNLFICSLTFISKLISNYLFLR